MERYQKSKEVYEELFGELPLVEEEKDHEFMEILRRFIFGDIFHDRELPYKIRELITVTILATMQTLPQLKSHLKACLKVGNSPIEIREAIYQLAPFIGFPKALNAIAIMNEVFTDQQVLLPLKSMGTVTDEVRYQAGFEIQNPIYGDEIKDRYRDYPEISKYLTEFCFGDFYTRKGLDLQTRELLIFVTLVTMRSEAQLKAHILGNLKVGNTQEVLYATLLQCLPYVGFPNIMCAMNFLKEMEGI